jgi:hypothetical protein
VTDSAGVGSAVVGLGSGCGVAVGSGTGEGVGVGAVAGTGEAEAAAATDATGLGAPDGEGPRSAATDRAEVIGPKPAPNGTEAALKESPGALDPPRVPDPSGLGEAFETRMM